MSNKFPGFKRGSYEMAFPEIVNFIDTRYRTIPDKAHRAIAGLSMGGMHSLTISANYPDLLIMSDCSLPDSLTIIPKSRLILTLMAKCAVRLKRELNFIGSVVEIPMYSNYIRNLKRSPKRCNLTECQLYFTAQTRGTYGVTGVSICSTSLRDFLSKQTRFHIITSVT